MKNPCQWLFLYEDAKILEKNLFLGIWMFLPDLFETKYIWIFSVFKVGIFIEKFFFPCVFNFYKQSFADVLQNKCSWKFCKLHRKTLKSESLFNKVPGLKACNFIKKRLRHRCFPVKFAKCLQYLFLQNTPGSCFWVLINFNSSTRLSDSAWRSSQVII